MRHFESGAAKRAAATASIPVINAGDGPGQHPTQVCILKFSDRYLYLLIKFLQFSVSFCLSTSYVGSLGRK